MLRQSAARMALGLMLMAALSGCVTLPPNRPSPPQDPWESWNRGVYKFNDVFDRAIAKPVART
jgi:phospholipid-binding lipoprotein MlaA